MAVAMTKYNAELEAEAFGIIIIQPYQEKS